MGAVQLFFCCRLPVGWLCRITAKPFEEGTLAMRVMNLLLCTAMVTLFTAATDFAQDSANQLIVDADATIPRGARIFISPIDGGFDIYLALGGRLKSRNLSTGPNPQFPGDRDQ